MTNTESSLNTLTYQTHEMKLHPAPFDLIKSGRKTVEMRLNDEKRQLVRIKDCIRFVNMRTAKSSWLGFLEGKCIRSFVNYIGL